MMQLGYSTWGMPTLPADVAIPYLAKLGFEAVELTVIPGWVTELSTLDAPARRAIRQLYDDYQVDLSALAGHVPILTPEDEYRQNLARLQAEVDLAVDLAGADGPPPLNTATGGAPEHWEADKELAVERIGELARYGESRGVVIALEPHVGQGLNSPDKTLWLLDQIDSPWLKVNFDISHFNVQGMSMEETVPPMAPVSVHTHVKDERGRAARLRVPDSRRGGDGLHRVPQADGCRRVHRLDYGRDQQAGSGPAGLRSVRRRPAVVCGAQRCLAGSRPATAAWRLGCVDICGSRNPRPRPPPSPSPVVTGGGNISSPGTAAAHAAISPPPRGGP